MDPYSVLGLSPTANADEVHSAYRSRARLLHPDRHHDADPKLRAAADVAFSQLRDAYEALRTLNTVNPTQTSTQASTQTSNRTGSRPGGGRVSRADLTDRYAHPDPRQRPPRTQAPAAPAADRNSATMSLDVLVSAPTTSRHGWTGDEQLEWALFVDQVTDRHLHGAVELAARVGTSSDQQPIAAAHVLLTWLLSKYAITDRLKTRAYQLHADLERALPATVVTALPPRPREPLTAAMVTGYAATVLATAAALGYAWTVAPALLGI